MRRKKPEARLKALTGAGRESFLHLNEAIHEPSIHLAFPSLPSPNCNPNPLSPLPPPRTPPPTNVDPRDNTATL